MCGLSLLCTSHVLHTDITCYSTVLSAAPGKTLTRFLSLKRKMFSQSELQNNFRQKWTEGRLLLWIIYNVKVESGLTESELFVDDNLRSWYVIYKVIVCLFFWSSIIYSWVVTSSGSTYLVFMTNWGICFLCPTILLETVIVLMMSSNLSPPSLLMLGNLSLTLQAQLTSPPS